LRYKTFIISRNTKIKKAGFVKMNYPNSKILKKILKKNKISIVINLIIYDPKQVMEELNFYEGKIENYYFISTTACYKPTIKGIINEDSESGNNKWKYAYKKLKCEEIFLNNFKKKKFPVTIIRAGNFYDKNYIPYPVIKSGIECLKIAMENKIFFIPKNINENLWSLIHLEDFASNFVKLLDKETKGKIINIAGEQKIKWKNILNLFAQTLKIKIKNVEIKNTSFSKNEKEAGLGDRWNSKVFHNKEIRKLEINYKENIQIEDGLRESIKYFKTNINKFNFDKKKILFYLNRVN
jgi:nucleoside-diphosphate-sugar epimerase